MRSPRSALPAVLLRTVAPLWAAAGPVCAVGAASSGLDLAQAVATEPDEGGASVPPKGQRMPKAFAEQDHWSVSVGAGLAFGGREADLYYNGFVSLETFLVRDFQLAIELGGWFFDQDEDDALGASINFDLRWHFLHDEERDRWSIFAAAGIGVLGATNDVPTDSSEFGFTPRIGAGFTWRFSDGPERLIAGVRWQHISNARLQGTRDNFGSDAAMVFVGVSIPF